MSVQIIDSEPPVTKERIAEVEQSLGIEIPAQYKAFLLEHNGGAPEPPKFLFQREREKPQRGVVAWFLAIYDGPHENFVKYFKTFQDRIPVDTVPIARDPGGNLVLMGTKGSMRGKVFFWTRDLETDDETPTEPELLYSVADSFEAFLKSLHDS